MLKEIIDERAVELLSSFSKLNQEQRQIILNEYEEEMQAVDKQLKEIHTRMMNRIRELTKTEEPENQTKRLIYSDSKYNVSIFETGENEPLILEGSAHDLAVSVGDLMTSRDKDKREQGVKLHLEIVRRGFKN